MPGEFGAIDLALAFVTGAIVVYMYWSTTRKKWYLESMNPRNHYELGRERKLLVNMKILNKTFNGVTAGKYTILLTHGSLSDFSKAIFHGKLEFVYSTVLAESLIGKKLVTAVEKKRFFSFLFERIPELAVRGYLITGELISPAEVIEAYWEDKNDQMKAWEEIKARKLARPQTLWIRPYPPEEKLKEIISGLLLMPDIIEQSFRDKERTTATVRKTIIQMNSAASQLLSEFIPLARLIISSISDPTFVMALILSERASQVRGIGLTQLAERGGMDGIIQAARELMGKKDEFFKIFGPPITKEERERIQNLENLVADLRKGLEALQKAGGKPMAQPPVPEAT